jgi:BirA family biotin operon repressor/biotin-[acetyl-CoA-carboxylase] ligase
VALLTHWEGEPVGVWEGVWSVPRLEAHDVLGSTNDRAWELARAGAPPYTVVVAERQTAGRGRGGARWHSPAGAGLWISVLLPVTGPVPPHLPLLVGLAAARAVEAVCAELDVGLKWPNDLEVEGRKAGGVLCEGADGCVVAGLGLNVRQGPEEFPAELVGRAVSLETAAGHPVSRGALASALLAELRRAGGTRVGPLPAAVRAELARRDVLRGRRVVSQQVGAGVARGIDEDGALLVERPDGARVRVLAGSVRIT